MHSSEEMVKIGYNSPCMSKKNRIIRRTKTVEESGLNATVLDAWLKRVSIMVLHVLVLTVPLFFLFTTNELFEFNKLQLVYVYAIVAGVAFAGRVILSKGKILTPTYLDIPLFLFVISQLLSTLFSIHPYTSLVGFYSRFHGGLLSVTSYVVLYYVAAHTLQRKDLSNLWLSTGVSAGLVALYAILERFGASMSCVMVDGTLTVDCWVQDVQSRVFASFGQPNWLAAYAVTLIPLFLTLTNIGKKTWRGYFFAVVTLLLVLALLFTKSRSGILGLYVGIMAWAGMLKVQAVITRDRSSSLIGAIRERFSGLAIITLVCAVALMVLVQAPYTPQIPGLEFGSEPKAPASSSDTTSLAAAENSGINRLEQGGTDSAEIRKIVWTGAMRIWQRYPWFGSGLETFGYSYYLDRPIEHNLVSEWDFLYNKAHNEFLNFLATTGAVGLISYLALLTTFGFIVLKDTWSTKTKLTAKKDLATTQTVAALGAGIAALSVTNFFGFSTVMVSVLMYLFFAVVQVLRSEQSQEEITHTRIQMGQWVVLIIVMVVGFWLLISVRNFWVADMRYTQARALLNTGDVERGMPMLSSAVALNPSEAHYVDELAQRYAQYAVALADAGDATGSAELAALAIQSSDVVMQINPEHLNFHRMRARLFMTLSTLNPSYLSTAADVLRGAMRRAPTDPKLLYNLGILELTMGNDEAGFAALEKAIAFKPNYIQARWELTKALIERDKNQEALDEALYIRDNLAPDDQAVLDIIATLSANLEPNP